MSPLSQVSSLTLFKRGRPELQKHSASPPSPVFNMQAPTALIYHRTSYLGSEPAVLWITSIFALQLVSSRTPMSQITVILLSTVHSKTVCKQLITHVHTRIEHPLKKRKKKVVFVSGSSSGKVTAWHKRGDRMRTIRERNTDPCSALLSGPVPAVSQSKGLYQ